MTNRTGDAIKSIIYKKTVKLFGNINTGVMMQNPIPIIKLIHFLVGTKKRTVSKINRNKIIKPYIFSFDESSLNERIMGKAILLKIIRSNAIANPLIIAFRLLLIDISLLFCPKLKGKSQLKTADLLLILFFNDCPHFLQRGL
ncbi:hypothetical protein WR164_03030 [Philodulcilactobacillus myokoensis]|uniref:Uncharacterized protein n=1 Tax=Philodulcilactobacillus myokoensis TaxID=2929573 RepID=A0A9W6AZH9_9LACO|nr:hypothetical protein [Philodulcilactobacillus myokoensis]GLB46324.1 hypothetical protein WR164_03030 [Philodulcilactobacillus myokoensis]